MPTARLRVPFSVLLIAASTSVRDIPSHLDGLLGITTDCIAVGSRAEDDGLTEVVLGAVADIDPGLSPIFDGMLKTPDRRITVLSMLLEPILQEPVRGLETTIRIWTNDDIEPDRIVIGIVQ